MRNSLMFVVALMLFSETATAGKEKVLTALLKLVAKEAPHAVSKSGSEIKFADEMLTNKAFRNETIEHIGRSDPKLAKELHATLGKASAQELKEAAMMARLEDALKRYPMHVQGNVDAAETTRIAKDITSSAYHTANAIPAQSEKSFLKKFVDATVKEAKAKRDWKVTDGKLVFTPPLQVGSKISFGEVSLTDIGKELFRAAIPASIAVGIAKRD